MEIKAKPRAGAGAKRARRLAFKAAAMTLAAVVLFTSASMSLDDIGLAYDKLIAAVSSEKKLAAEAVPVVAFVAETESVVVADSADAEAAEQSEVTGEPESQGENAPVFLSAVMPADDTEEDVIKKHFFGLIEENQTTGKLYGKDQKGLLGIGFDYDKKNEIWYTPINAWQRNFGYMHAFDAFAPLFGIYITSFKCKIFYDQKEWMIQFWRGQYGITSGAEMGVYYREPDTGYDFYDCVADEDMLPMSMKIYRNGELFFERSEDAQWWLTGFVLPSYTNANNFTCDMSITLKDEEMRDLFLDEMVETNGFVEGENMTVEGNKVSFVWD